MSIEEKVICDKLQKYSKTVEQQFEMHNEIENIYLRKRINQVENAMVTMNSNKFNTSYRFLEQQAGLRGKIKWFIKKVIRKLNFFYVQPICDQQTLFNNSVTDGIEHLNAGEIILYQNIKEVEKELQKDFSDKLEKEIKELQKDFSDKLEKEIDEKKTLQNMVYELNSRLDDYVEKFSNMQICEEDFPPTKNNFWLKQTYAQSGEDAIVQYILYVLGIPWEKVTYLDLGANHAKELSNTYALYKRGARGVLLEANPGLIPELKLYRNEDVILNKCLALTSDVPVNFYILSGDGLSSSDKAAVDVILKKNPSITIQKEVLVEAIAINDILDNYFVDAPTVLNIDIEGMEIEILKQINFTVNRPLIVIAEMIEYSTTINNNSKNRQLLQFMEEKSYIEYAFTGINSIFVDKSVWDCKREEI